MALSNGTAGNDTLTGTAVADTLNGLAGNDLLSGLAGNDSLSGGDGDDTLIGGGGKDTIDGGAGNDIATLAGSPSTYTSTHVNATDVRLTNGTDTVLLRNVEVVRFVDGAIVRDIPIDYVAPDLGTATADELHGSQYLFGSSIDGLAGNDTLHGGVLNDTLIGGKGDDKMLGYGGDDTYEVDSLNDYVEEMAGRGTDLVNVKLTSGSYTLGDNVENGTVLSTGTVGLIGNELANVLTGGAGANTLDGMDGNDTLIGGAGNDTLIGGLGVDSMTGGTGNDTYEVDSLDDVVVEAANGGTDTVKVNIGTDGAIYALGANVENAIVTSTAGVWLDGNDLANTLTGNAASNLLDGGKGADRLIGGAGDDEYIVDVAGDVITEAAVGGGHDTVYLVFTANGTYTMAANVEDGFIDSDVDIRVNLTGNASDNRLDGSSGTNVLMGGLGNDTLNGHGSYASLKPAPDTLDGGLGTDVAEFDGNQADYVVARPSTTDVSLTNRLTGDVTIVRNVEFFSFADTTNNIALAELKLNTAGTGNDNLGGTASGDWIDGLAGNDTLNGFAGNDTLIGGAGNDSLIGSLGDDSMEGGAGNDIYDVDSLGDIVVEGANAGTDVVNVSIVNAAAKYVLSANVETATLTAAADVQLVGNAQNNTLNGNAQDNWLEGGAGNDTLNGYAGDDVLIGGAGTDRLVGGAGNDVYLVNSASDVVVELANEGSNDLLAVDGDAVAGTYTLSANVENGIVFPFSTTAINLTGNGLANVLIGNAGVNVLNGGAGDDFLSGAEGNDKLTGGLGADAFVFDTTPNALSNVDTITDFNASQGDQIHLSFDVFSSLGPAGGSVDLSGDYLNYNRTTGALTYDADGAGGDAAVTIAILGTSTHPALSNSDIVLFSVS